MIKNALSQSDCKILNAAVSQDKIDESTLFSFDKFAIINKIQDTKYIRWDIYVSKSVLG